jgi:hypothetical protein
MDVGRPLRIEASLLSHTQTEARARYTQVAPRRPTTPPPKTHRVTIDRSRMTDRDRAPRRSGCIRQAPTHKYSICDIAGVLFVDRQLEPDHPQRCASSAVALNNDSNEDIYILSTHCDRS